MNAVRYITKVYKPPSTSRLPIEIPSLSRAELAKIFTKLGFTKGAQVGIWNGAYSKILCTANPHLTLYGIDLNSRTNRKGLEPHLHLLKGKSLDMAKKVVNQSLDFVYLDTNSDFASQTADIQTWIKKVKKGGIIAGDDYIRYRSTNRVRAFEAVHAYTRAHRVSPWFVIGRNVDKVRSWFWVV